MKTPYDATHAQRNIFYTLLVAIPTLNIIDLIVTAHEVMPYGSDVEANPFVRWMLSISPALPVIYKMGLSIGFVITALFAARKNFKSTCCC